MPQIKKENLAKKALAFFFLLENRKWKDAEFTINGEGGGLDRGDKYHRGFSDALKGMLTSLKESKSTPEPYISTIMDNSEKRLKELERTFYRVSRGELISDYDRGFYIAWREYIKFLVRKNSQK